MGGVHLRKCLILVLYNSLETCHYMFYQRAFLGNLMGGGVEEAIGHNDDRDRVV